MDNNEIIKKIAEKLSLDPELLKTVGDLTLSGEDCKIAEEQTPDTMYVLTGRVAIKTDETEVKYHYHPVIKDCLLSPAATANEMVASPDLIELQGIKGQYSYPVQGVEYVILAVPYEVYKNLQEQLDETIAGVIANVRHAAEAFMKNNEFASNGMLSFEKIYQDILYQLMRMSNTVIGSALNEKSQIVKSISDVSYEGLNIDQNFDEGECDYDCSNCSREFCPEEDDEVDEEDDEDEDDDSGGSGTTMFFGFHR